MSGKNKERLIMQKKQPVKFQPRKKHTCYKAHCLQEWGAAILVPFSCLPQVSPLSGHGLRRMNEYEEYLSTE